MKIISNKLQLLDETIANLEAKQAELALELKSQLSGVYNNLKPLNILKNTWNDAIHSNDFKSDLTSATLGLLSGFASKKILVGSSQKPVKVLMGNLLQFMVTNVVANHGMQIKDIAFNFWNKLTTQGVDDIEVPKEEVESFE